jgi:hypothetical protein
MEEDQGQEKAFLKVGVIVGVTVVFLLVVIFTWHQWTVKRQSEVVLHSGVTYTGPTPTGNPVQPVAQPAKFTAPTDSPTKTIKGQQYQYSFEIPETLELVRLDENPYDIWAVKYNNVNPSSAVLIGVDNLQNNETLRQFINQPKIAYVEYWWKQFGGLTGVSSITPFTNSKGMKGYKAKFTTANGPSNNDDVFFEVPGRKNLVIHLSNGVLDPAVFERIVDSVRWGNE